MTRIGITGHRGLRPSIAEAVDHDLRTALRAYPASNLVGVSALADGADQIFAQAVLDRGGRLEVIVPASRYREGLPQDCHRAYDALLGQASAVHRLDHHESTSDAHMDASRIMLNTVDELVAVWDGEPARGYGGTADVVAEAKAQGLPVRIIWPKGATRD